MSARIRGEHDTRGACRWRPSASREEPTASAQKKIAAGSGNGLAPVGIAGRPGRGRSHGARRLLRWAVVLAVAMLAAGLAAGWSVAQLSPRPGSTPARLPVTPRAWLDAYEAAAIDNPGRVCTVLFAPALAHTYANAVHGSCRGYFQRITSFSVAVRRVLTDGGTAVLELRQTVSPRDWAVVLDRRRTGWQAVDLLSGNLAR
jgi:hypothetical protein